MGEILDGRRVGAERSPALGADARQLEPVLEAVEAVRRGDVVEPRVEPAVRELDHAVAARAHEVVVVLAAAEAVAGLARAVREHVDDAFVGQDGERAVHGGEADALPAGAEALVQLLRGGVVRLARELREHARALRRRADAPLAEQCRCLPLRLPRPGHAATVPGE